MIQGLPSRRHAPTIAFDLFDGYTCQGYSAQYAEFVEGDLAEVFLKPEGGPNAKVGMPLDTMAKDLSVLFSIARRYGAPVPVIRAALSQQADGEMLGPLGEFLRLHEAERQQPDKAERQQPNEPEPAPVEPPPSPKAPAGAAATAEAV